MLIVNAGCPGHLIAAFSCIGTAAKIHNPGIITVTKESPKATIRAAIDRVVASPRFYKNTIPGGDGQNNACRSMSTNVSCPEIINNFLFRRDEDPARYSLV